MTNLAKAAKTIPLYIMVTLAAAGLLKFGVHIIRMRWLTDLPSLDYVTAVQVTAVFGTLASVWAVGNTLAKHIRKS